MSYPSKEEVLLDTLTNVLKRARSDDSAKRIKELENGLKKAIDLLYKDVCFHENLTRGGAIWTICTDCNRKWADDRGGFKPNPILKEIEKLEDILNGTV